MAKAKAKSKRRKFTNPPHPDLLIKTAWHTVCAMERDMTAARHFASAVAMLAETCDDAEGVVFQQIAWAIGSHVDAAEERRGELFHALHPNREIFAREGRPDEQPAEQVPA